MIYRAKRVDANQQSIIDALEGAGCLVADTSAVGQGFPDLVAREPVWPHLIRLLEVKNPAKPKRDQQLTPDQVVFHGRWQVVHVVKTADEALRVMGISTGTDAANSGVSDAPAPLPV